MRVLPLSFAAALGILFTSGVAAAAECPLDLSLKTAPDAIVAKLNAMPSFQSGRQPGRKPFGGQCSYQTSNFMQFGTPTEGVCSIGGVPAFGSALDIVDSESSVASHTFIVPRSDESLAAIRSALGKIATPVAAEADPDAWKAKHYWITDAVYAQGDDLWIVSHQQADPGSTSMASQTYMLTHVRREWLDFARRDLNTCAELPKKREA